MPAKYLALGRPEEEKAPVQGLGLRWTSLVVALEKPGAGEAADYAENDRERDCLSHRIPPVISRLAYKRLAGRLVGA